MPDKVGRDEKFMTVAIKLAEKGLFSVEPNPAVGAVIVKNDEIIGKGFHKEFGKEHAEINAINDAIKKGNEVKGASLYVTLEPCCHYGKTPPCTKAIIESGISKVIVSALDPSEKVSGKGVRTLKRAGLTVKTGVLAERAEKLNNWFYKFHRERKPWVICKWAQTIDGKLAARSGHSKWISTAESRKQAHRLRRSCQAIVIGLGTANADNPSLTVRNVPQTLQPAPARVVLDTKLRIKQSSELAKSADSIDTYLITSKLAINRKQSKAKELERKGMRIVPLAENDEQMIDISEFLKFCANKNWPRVMIEGGAKLIGSVLRENLADELVIFLSNKFAMDKYAKGFDLQSTQKVSDFLSSYGFVDVAHCADDLILRLWRK